MLDDSELRRNSGGKTKKGANFEGKQIGNNFALSTSKQPSAETRSKAWEVRNRLLKGAKEIAEFAESTQSQTVIVDGQEVQMSMLAHAYYKQLKLAIDKGDTRAFLAYIQATSGLKTNHGFTDNEGNPASILVQMIKTGVKLK